MKKIKIADMTLRESVFSGQPLSFREKIEIAKQLDALNVDIIELAPLADVKADSLLVKSIASVVKNSVLSIDAGMTAESAEAAWEAVSGAAKPRLHVVVPVSAVQMEYIFHKKPDGIIEHIKSMVAKCAALCPDVEFSAGDATRSEKLFLYSAVSAAMEAGAKTVTFCDSSGTAMPGELAGFIGDAVANVPALAEAEYAVQCSNELKMAAACAFASVQAGAGIVKTTVCGQTTPTLDAIAQAIRLRGDSLGITSRVNTTILNSVMKQMVSGIRARRSETSPFDNGVKSEPSDNIMFDETANITAVIAAVKGMGYELSDDDSAKVFDAVIHAAKKKQNIGSKELEAIVASTANQAPPTYKLVSYVVTTGNKISPMAQIVMEKDGAEVSGLSTGDGPVDAAFLAIEKITGHHYELDDYQIQAVTEGREAMGDAIVKLRTDGQLYSGKGISTDVLGASIRAYINALNKIVYVD
ncbi:MAG: hypothetical protein FWF05_07270 [Oscillospiraceae bacterium]|nr:hypothetical protein [Oscillospiraceae bacterium]